MMISYFKWGRPITFESNLILVMEDKKEFNTVASDIINQAKGMVGSVIISDSNDYGFNIKKDCVCIPSLIDFTINTRTYLTKLLELILVETKHNNEFTDKCRTILSNINFLGEQITVNSHIPMEFDYIEFIDGVIKLLNIRFDENSEDLYLKLQDLIINLSRIGIKLLMTIDIGAYIEKENLAEIFQLSSENGIKIINLTSSQGEYTRTEYNDLYVIDRDFCEIRL